MKRTIDGRALTGFSVVLCPIGTRQVLFWRERPYHKASLRAGSRQVELILTAFPMGVASEEIEPLLAQALAV